MPSIVGKPTRKQRAVLDQVAAHESASDARTMGYSFAESEGLVNKSSPCVITSTGEVLIFDESAQLVARADLDNARHDGSGTHLVLADGSALRLLGDLNEELRAYGTDELAATRRASQLVLPDRLDAPIDINIPNCEVAGGAGFPLAVGEQVTLRFTEDGYQLTLSGRDSITNDYTHLLGIALSGPGRETSGGGFLGGGFGLEGAAVGIGVAAVLNALTTSTSITTIIELTTADGELFLINGREEPGRLRIALSPVLVRIRTTHAG